MKKFLMLAVCLTAFSQAFAQTGGEEERYYYLDNGKVRIGVDLGGGGCVFYFAESSTGRNLLNYADKGRYVQQSYYGIEDGSRWGETPWCWNPVQGGGYRHSPATILDRKLKRRSLWIRTRPKHWASGEDIADAVMEESITLEGNVAHIHYRFVYDGKVPHPAKAQELPAVFVDYALPNLVVYDGGRPWTNGRLTSVVPGWPNEFRRSDECWAAYVDDDQWGIGVYFPGTVDMTTYRFEGPSGPQGGGCSYFAPIKQFAITPGFVYEYDVYLTIGSVDEIRATVYRLHGKG